MTPEHRVVRRWHRTVLDHAQRCARVPGVLVKFRVIHPAATTIDVRLHHPGNRRDARICRILDFVRVATEAGAGHEVAGLLVRPLWLPRHRRVAVGLAVGHELDGEERSDRRSEDDRNEALCGQPTPTGLFFAHRAQHVGQRRSGDASEDQDVTDRWHPDERAEGDEQEEETDRQSGDESVLLDEGEHPRREVPCELSES